MTKTEWRKYLDEKFPQRSETMTVLQLGEVMGTSNASNVEKGIREGMYPGKAVFNKATGRFKYIIHKWNVAAWLAEGGLLMIGG